MAKKVSNSGFSDWTPDQLPDLNGKSYIITGGNSGIGFEAAKMLGKAGADIIIACRNLKKAEKAVGKIIKATNAQTEAVPLDLSDLNSVRAAADLLRGRLQKIDGLINNAGIMQTPQMETAQGYELQFGTNHLGHFLLTGLLFDLVEAAEGRIVTVASLIHKYGKIYFDDLMLKNNYEPMRAYGQSKLANLIIAFELHRRLKAKNSPVASIACHPGYTATNLQSTGPTGLMNLIYKPFNLLFAQSTDKGAIPTALAAAGTEAVPGAYYGPQNMSETRGRVSDATVAPQALDEEAATRLWAESEKLVGFEWTKP